MKEIFKLKHQLDSIGVENTVKVYANATHAFTNPDAIAAGKKFNMPIEYPPLEPALNEVKGVWWAKKPKYFCLSM